MAARYAVGDTVQVRHHSGRQWVGEVELVNEIEPGVWEYVVSNGPDFMDAPAATMPLDLRLRLWESEIIGHYVGESD